MNERRFWRDIVGVLVVKALGLAALYALFFTPSERPVVTTQAVAQHFIVLLSQSSVARQPGDEQ